MAFPGAEKAFFVLQFAKCESTVMVQRRFRTEYHKDPPTDKPIRTWYNNFEHTGSLSASQDGSPLLPWPPRSPDLSPCYFFLTLDGL